MIADALYFERVPHEPHLAHGFPALCNPNNLLNEKWTEENNGKDEKELVPA